MMTVASLKKKLANLPDDMPVVIYHVPCCIWDVTSAKKNDGVLYIKSSPLDHYINKYSME